MLGILATFHPLEQAAAVLAAGQARMADAPDALLWTSFLRRGPTAAPWMTPALAGRPGIMSLIEWSGDRDEGRALLEPIERDLAAPAGELTDVPYLAMQQITDELLAPGTLHAYVKAGFTAALSPALVEQLVERGGRVGSALSVIEVLSMGGAIRHVPDAATAFAHRSAQWLVNVVGQWSDAGDTDAERAWVRESFAALEPHLTGGAYSNFMEGDEVEAAGVAYGATLERLREVKAVYDPANRFRFNQNVLPAAP